MRLEEGRSTVKTLQEAFLGTSLGIGMAVQTWSIRYHCMGCHVRIRRLYT